ncbi:MAG: LLM class flavin-dependent oxidoreductase [Beijerinckiaceae bacterium]|jgi:alkanesulfonate monooxygenase SsuD/methylene tetrahydromethanopterin reductase-like flavin-dependent oxidoreductase (luciferase family)|nr:LLM class flavin-dependent oxidoreductase [Beijerinckiaceae bacterium]
MKVGLFDHIAVADRPLSQVYDERVEFHSAVDEAGFYCIHIAEHHCAPICMAPSPSVYLSILARATKQIKLGPLCYLLPLYTPLRMIEEICMLDHLSNGRMETGIGRGVSPFEMNYNNIDHSKSREIFIDAYNCIKAGMSSKTFNYSGEYYSYKDVPMWMEPLQKPWPAFWYGSSNTTGATFAGEEGMHFTANGPTDFAKNNIEAFRVALKKRGGAAQPKPEFEGGAAIGISRHIFVADTDEEAMRIARPACDHHHESINWLRNKHNINEFTARLNVPRAHDLDGMIAEGSTIVGSPSTVLNAIKSQQQVLGNNYLLAYMIFGNLPLKDALRSLELFKTEVMPELDKL